MAASRWVVSRQRDFTKGENLSRLPEMVGRDQFSRMVNAIISPQGQVTDCHQLDTTLFQNVGTGIVVVPVPNSRLFIVFFPVGNTIESFVFDPDGGRVYDLAAASGYQGYTVKTHGSPIAMTGIQKGVPFLGKDYCIAATSLYLTGGEITSSPSPIAFGTVETITYKRLSVTVTNNTAGAVTLSAASITGTNSGLFGMSASWPQVLAAGGMYTFSIDYSPVAAFVGANTATLSITTTSGIVQFALTGTASTIVSAARDNVYSLLSYAQTLQASFMADTAYEVNQRTTGALPNPYGYDYHDTQLRNQIQSAILTINDVIANPGLFVPAKVAVAYVDYNDARTAYNSTYGALYGTI